MLTLSGAREGLQGYDNSPTQQLNDMNGGSNTDPAAAASGDKHPCKYWQNAKSGTCAVSTVFQGTSDQFMLHMAGTHLYSEQP